MGRSLRSDVTAAPRDHTSDVTFFILILVNLL